MSSITLFANIVGKTVLADTIRESTSSIYSILSSNQIGLNTHLEIYDFENRLKIIDALLKLSLESIKILIY